MDRERQPGPIPDKLRESLRGFKQFSPDFEVMLIDLVTVADDGFPEDIELYCVLSVMQAVFRRDVAERMLRIYKRLKPKLHIPTYQDRWRHLLYYLLSNSKYLTKKDYRGEKGNERYQ
ncbi:MAG: hypothetical protein LBQ54_09905 [Planctomycetaceae bacterium]|jgi:hypothetical protein|nr:hypothetical protein [Planctomycetaceae bacterium]